MQPIYRDTAAGVPVLQDRCGMTGIRSSLVRPGFAEFDEWGHGLALATSGYCLDAPVALPRGSSLGAFFSHCTGGRGPRSVAFVVQTTLPTTFSGDRV